MAYTPKELTGRIFDNALDKKNEKQPDFTGNLTVEGKVYRVAAWYSPPSPEHRTGSYGMKLTPIEEWERQKEARAEQRGGEQQPSSGKTPPPADDFDDDTPF